MSDVWRELMERLKQKAIKQYKLHETFEKTILTKEYRTRELWVRLEDVKEAINQLKQRQKQILFNKCKQEWEICHKECEEIECIIKELYFEFFGESIKELLDNAEK